METRGRKPHPKPHGEEYEIPEPPEHLSSPKEKETWRYLWEHNGGLVKPSDMLLVINLCEAIKDKEFIRRKIEMDGAPPVISINGNKTMVRNPLHIELRELRKDINGMLAELGLTPSGRTKLTTIVESNDELLSLIREQRNSVITMEDNNG